MDITAFRTLEEAEKIIGRWMDDFIEVGNALAWIRDNDMYMEKGYKTFEAYCKEEWGFNRAHAYRLIGSAKVAEALSPIGDKINLEQTRPLIGKSTKDIISLYEEALETAPDGKVTGAHIQETVRQREEGPINEVLMAHHYTTMAINQLKKIDKKDPSRRAQGYKVINWCKNNLTGGKYHE